MVITKRAILFSLAVALASVPRIHAQGASASTGKRASAVLILGTLTDRPHESLSIHGMGFGDRPAQVWCEDYAMTVLSWRDTEVVVHLPAAVPDGSYLLTIIKGDGQKDRDSFAMTVQGAPIGVAGPKGEKGEPGPPGEAGPAGPRGEPGIAGPQGEAGPRGIQGETGAVGPQGPAGAVGSQGPAGAVGPQGPAGAVGPQGASGAEGAPGAMGPMGPAGPVGPAGPIGPAGPAGPEGPQGVAGAAGLTGPPGPMGPVGPAGPEGAQGAAGVPGAAGPIGPAGPAGPEGAQGAQGPQGTSGPAGAMGPMGPIGPMGPAGPQGVPGVSGYEVVATPVVSVTVNGNQTTTLSAACPAGKIAVGGGFDYSGNVAPITPVASFPAAADTWRVMVRLSQVSAASFQGRVFAICAAAR